MQRTRQRRASCRAARPAPVVGFRIGKRRIAAAAGWQCSARIAHPHRISRNQRRLTAQRDNIRAVIKRPSRIGAYLGRITSVDAVDRVLRRTDRGRFPRPVEHHPVAGSVRVDAGGRRAARIVERHGRLKEARVRAAAGVGKVQVSRSGRGRCASCVQRNGRATQHVHVIAGFGRERTAGECRQRGRGRNANPVAIRQAVCAGERDNVGAGIDCERLRRGRPCDELVVVEIAGSVVDRVKLGCLRDGRNTIWRQQAAYRRSLPRWRRITIRRVDVAIGDARGVDANADRLIDPARAVVAKELIVGRSRNRDFGEVVNRQRRIDEC